MTRSVSDLDYTNKEKGREGTHFERDKLVVDATNVEDAHAEAQDLVERGEIHLTDQALRV